MATLKDIAQLASVSNRNCIPDLNLDQSLSVTEETRHRILTEITERTRATPNISKLVNLINSNKRLPSSMGQ